MAVSWQTAARERVFRAKQHRGVVWERGGGREREGERVRESEREREEVEARARK